MTTGQHMNLTQFPRWMSLSLLLLCLVFALILSPGPQALAGNEKGAQKCSDGIDNDGDGLTDCQDPDCAPQCGGGGGSANPAIACSTGGELFVMNADGSNLTRVYKSSLGVIDPLSPSWSPLGSGTQTDPYSIASHHFPPSTRPLHVIDVAVVNGVPTGMNDRILADSADCGFCANPAWSPLGDEIAVDGGCDPLGLVVINAFSGGAQELYTPPANRQVFGGSAWRSDGLQIAFVEEGHCLSGLSPDPVIKILDLTTNPPTVTRTLLQGQFTDINGLDWARTQDTLAFEADGAIYTLDLWLASPVPVFITEGRSPSWSPNDTQLAFEAFGRRNQAGVHILTLATGAITRLSGCGWPDWRR